MSSPVRKDPVRIVLEQGTVLFASGRVGYKYWTRKLWKEKSMVSNYDKMMTDSIEETKSVNYQIVLDKLAEVALYTMEDIDDPVLYQQTLQAALKGGKPLEETLEALKEHK
jgi:hypothetical protein